MKSHDLDQLAQQQGQQTPNIKNKELVEQNLTQLNVENCGSYACPPEENA